MFPLTLSCEQVAVQAKHDGRPEIQLFGPAHHMQFGRLSSGVVKRQDFILINSRSDPIEIGVIKSSCPCLTVNLKSRRIDGNGSAQGEVVVDATREPDSQGELLLAAEGKTSSGEAAFVIQVEVNINPSVERVGSIK